MPESPCANCGKPCVHTEDDEWPECADCHRIRTTYEVLEDMVYGRLRVPDTAEEEKPDV